MTIQSANLYVSDYALDMHVRRARAVAAELGIPLSRFYGEAINFYASYARRTFLTPDHDNSPLAVCPLSDRPAFAHAKAPVTRTAPVKRCPPDAFQVSDDMRRVIRAAVRAEIREAYTHA